MSIQMRRVSLLALALVIALAAYCGIRLKDGLHVVKAQFYSDSLKKVMRVDVYLPPNYSRKVRYPVVYLLHGKDGNQNSWMTSLQWFDSIHINQVATRLMGAGNMRPMVIVAPEIDNGYGIDTSVTSDAVGGYSRGQYGTFITKDLVNYIDGHYSTVKSREGRYIGGFSMGGFAALHAAFMRPDLYSKVGVMSAALWVGGLPSSLAWIYPTAADQQSRDPLTIAKHAKIRMPVYIIEGNSDPFYTADVALAKELQAQSANVTLHTYPGGHTYAFWRSHAAELLSFFAGTSANVR